MIASRPPFMSLPVQPPPAGPIPPLEESQWQVGTLAYTKNGLARLFSWLLWGDFAWQIRDRSMATVLQLVLKKFDASDTLAGLLSGTFPSAISFVFGPIISYQSDRTRTRRGRRIPFLLVAAPVAAVATIGLGTSPLVGNALHHALGTRSPGLFPCILAVLAVWWVVFDFATTVTNSMFGALVNDVVPHGIIGRFYGLMRAVSLLVGIAFNYYLLSRAEEHYQWTFVSVGAVYGFGLVLMCLKVREGEYPPPPAAEGSGLGRFVAAIRGYFEECFTRPFFLWYFIAVSIASLTLAPVNIYSVFFAKSVGMSMDSYGKYLAASYLCSFFLTYGVGWLADRFHPLRLSMVVITLYGLLCLWGGFYAVSPRTFGLAFLAHGVLVGTYLTASASLAQRLLPRENFAQLVSASGMLGSLLGIVFPPIMGHFLDASNHNYRLTFFAGSVLSFLALGCQMVVYRYWRRYGGPHHFVPPL